MADLTFSDMQAIERTHVCAVCDGPLVVVWNGSPALGYLPGYEVRCGQNKEHTGIRRFRSEKRVSHITHLKAPKGNTES